MSICHADWRFASKVHASAMTVQRIIQRDQSA
jgi:hypothetical protein